jgi:hypothetical protein
MNCITLANIGYIFANIQISVCVWRYQDKTSSPRPFINKMFLVGINFYNVQYPLKLKCNLFLQDPVHLGNTNLRERPHRDLEKLVFVP